MIPKLSSGKPRAFSGQVRPSSSRCPSLFFVHGSPNDFRRWTIHGLEKSLRDAELEIESYTRVGNAGLTILNCLATTSGFQRGSWWSRPLWRTITVAANVAGLILARVTRVRVEHAEQLTTNDRTCPAGYVVLARNRRVAEAKAVATTTPCCPVCWGKLALDESEISCAGCDHTYLSVDGIPVLAVDEALHLEYESRGVVSEPPSHIARSLDE